MEEVQSVLDQILKSLVANPDDVEMFFSTETDEQGDLHMINVKVHRDDVGLCIGVGGKHAEAIRTIIGLVGYKYTGTRVYVRIDAPKVPKPHFEY